jgi:hypothetical protein
LGPGRWTGSARQRIELLRWTQFACGTQLTLTDHVHDLDSRLVGAALVDRDCLRRTMMAVGLAQEAERSLTIPLDSQEEITVAPALSTARYK